MKLTTVLIGILAFGAGAVASGCSKEKPAAPAVDSSMPGGMAMPAAGPGPVTVSKEELARLGILVVAAEVRTLARDVRLMGRVVPAETAARTVTSRVDGFVERLVVDFAGRTVRRVIEKPRYVDSQLKGCGLYVFDPHIFDAIRRTPRTAMRDELSRLRSRGARRCDVVVLDALERAPAEPAFSGRIRPAPAGRS